MSVQRRRQVLAPDLRHESLAVKSPSHRGLQSNDFSRIGGERKAFGQIPEFIRAELPAASQLEGMLNHFGLLVGRKPIQFFNHFGRSHEPKFILPQSDFKQLGPAVHGISHQWQPSISWHLPPIPFVQIPH